MCREAAVAMCVEDADTICAVSTPPGEGGIGIIRISGPEARVIFNKIFKPKNRSLENYHPARLYLGHIIDPADSRQIDEVLAVFMPAPGTYTREDIAEIHSHGGFAVQKAILAVIVNEGARLARPGEFTKRAFMNGRLDLIQAESVLDIIRSATDEELCYALSYLKGDLSKKIGSFRETLKGLLAEVEASIDFPEEDINIDLPGQLQSLERTQNEIDGLISSYYEGKGLKQGYEVLIAGRANVGKSSLLNALLSQERAIVTDLPGTTRDLIEEAVFLDGIKVRLIDTAGIGTPQNVVEEEGIRRVKQKASEADLIIWVLDGSQPYKDEDEDVFNTIKPYNYIVVKNKLDITQTFNDNILISKNINEWLEISAKERIGLEGLRSILLSTLTKGGRSNGALLITTVRHRDILAKVSANITAVLGGLNKGEHIELVAFELREALHHLGEITGETCTEEILGDIFSRFCIGK